MKNFNQSNRGDRRGFGGQGSASRTMYPAICDKCGQACEVPFKPSGGKPIYCNNCFDKNKSFDSDRSGGRDFDRGDRPNKQMFSAICTKCGKNCEVPFKPSGDKPVYCSDCFSQNRSNENKNFQPSSQPAKDQFTIINAKLDKILNALNPAVKADNAIKPNKTITVIAEKKVVAKKPSQKKAIVAAKTKKKKK